MTIKYFSVYILLQLAIIVSGDITSDLARIANRNSRTSSFYDTSWPTDHADSARNKFSVNSGFQFDKNFSKSTDVWDERHFQIQSVDLGEPVEWLVTRNKDEIYTMIGPRTGLRVLKMNATTLEILQTAPLKSSLYMGGMAVLKNGHVYCVIGNRLYRFWDGNLDNSTFVDLPRIEGGLEETNGMVATSNGYLIIKTWTMNVSEYAYARAANGLDFVIMQVSIAFGVVGVLWSQDFSKLKTNTKKAVIGFVVGVLFSWILIILLAGSYITYVKGPWSPMEGIFGEWRQKFSKISVVDPNSMEVVNSVNLTFDRISFARMALTSSSLQPGVDDLVTLGEEFVIRWKYYHSNHSLVIDEDWTERYRQKDDGSYPGTGPTILNDIVYFTDNTFPQVYAPVYRFYSKSLIPETSQVNVNGTLKNTYKQMLMKNINTPGDAGFMYYSPTVVPYASKTKNDTLDACILVWDTQGRTLQCRDLLTLDLVWQQHAAISDCATASVRIDPVTGDTQTLVYFNDYDIAPTTPLDWMRVTAADKNHYKKNTKYLMVANGENGKVLAKIALRKGNNVILPSMVVPGQNGDVFISSRNHFIRISQQQTQQ